MTRFLRWTAPVSLLILMLSGCGNLLGEVLPDRSVSDPLDLHGESVTVVFGGAPALRLQQVSGSGGLAEPIAFADGDLGTGAGDPVSLEIDGGFAATVILEGGVYPDTIVLSDIVLTIQLWEGTETFDQASSAFESDIDTNTTLTLEKDDPACSASCSYTFAQQLLASSSLLIRFDGSDLSEVLAIISESPKANFIDATLGITASSTPELAAGSSLSFTLDADDGTMAF